MRLRILLFLLAMQAANPTSAATAVLPAGAVLVRTEAMPDPSERQQLQQRMQGALARGDVAAAIAAFESTADPRLAEAAAAALIDDLRAEPIRLPAASGWLQWLAAQPPRVYVRHEETAADWFLPLHDLANRAAGTLQLWQADTAREAWQRQFARTPAAALAALADSDDAEQRAAAAAAVATLPAIEFDALRRAAATLDIAPDMAVAIAERSDDPAAWQRVLAAGDDQQRLQLVARAGTRLAPQAALDWLQQAMSRPALASAALLAVAELAAREPAAGAVLRDALDDPELGPSAAAGLARSAEVDRVARIEALLDADAGTLKRRHLALALRLEGSAAADAVLQRWARDPAMPRALRRELQR
jgi:hypothetical protein